MESHAKASALLQEPAPDATFSDAGANKQETTGIVGLMEMIIEDLRIEIKNAIAAEEKAQAEYDKQVAQAKKLIAELEEKKTTLEETIASRKEDKVAEEEKKKQNEEV